MVGNSITGGQLSLPLGIEKEIEIDGIGMGVLTDGTPYLTARGLARMCGVDHAAIVRMTQNWGEPKKRERRIQEIIAQSGIVLASPYIEIHLLGTAHYAYPDTVCMAVLEYYAFEAEQVDRTKALHTYRFLARKSLEDFIYGQVGYDPRGAIPIAWQQFHDRVTAAYGGVPNGYFSIFKEAADLIVTLIRGGADVGVHFIPDISIGIAWSKYWVGDDLDSRFGKREKYAHNYPQYFPQAMSNPQDAHCYPDAALGEFRRWMRETYLPDKLPTYLQKKVKEGALPASFAEMARLTFSPE